LFLIYPEVSQTILEMYVCREVEGVWYMVADFNLICYDARWKSYLPGNIIAIIVYPIGIPFLFFLLLLWSRRNFYKNSTRIQFGFLYDGYAKDTWWFELVDMAHKLYLTSILAFIPTNQQSWAGMIVAILYAIIILLRKPYYRKGDDRLHLFAQVEIFLLLMVGNTEAYGGLPDPALDVIISVFLILLVLGFITLFLTQTVNIIMKIFKLAWAVRKADFEKRQWAEDKEWAKSQDAFSQSMMLAVSGDLITEMNRQHMIQQLDDQDEVLPPPKYPPKYSRRISAPPPPPPNDDDPGENLPGLITTDALPVSGSFEAQMEQGRVMRLSTVASVADHPVVQGETNQPGEIG